MSFFAILFALLLEQVRPLTLANPVYEGVRQWARWGSRSLDAGRVPHGWLAWLVVVCGPALLATITHWLLVGLLGWLGLLLAFAFHALVLYCTLGFRQFSHHFTIIRDALDAGDEALARAELARWKQVDTADLPASEIVRHVIEYSVLAAHRHVFAVLGWYALLAAFGLGPAGAVLYRMAEFVRRYFAQRPAARAASLDVSAKLRASESLSAAAQRGWYVVDYLPARVTSLGFAIVGNFEDAIDSWRNYAQRLSRSSLGADLNENDGAILAATSGAVNVRLGGEALKEVFNPLSSGAFQSSTSDSTGERIDTTAGSEQSAGREPQFSHLKSVVGLVWRSVVLWMLLLALLTLAKLLG
jgi:adenosylcobinamide-phosphate synthase